MGDQWVEKQLGRGACTALNGNNAQWHGKCRQVRWSRGRLNAAVCAPEITFNFKSFPYQEPRAVATPHCLTIVETFRCVSLNNKQTF